MDTLVPLFAVHLVWKRSNPWDEVFGRVPMNGIMATVPTSPSPSSTQGRVLHPTQNRMCSVREFALAQGFKDTFKLTGTASQVGTYRNTELRGTKIVLSRLELCFPSIPG